MLTEVTRSIHEVSEGELIQTEQTEKLAMTREIYYDIIYKKTAALLGACGATGAISVGADEEHVNRMREFGNNLGVAFQIKDDILDYSPMESDRQAHRRRHARAQDHAAVALRARAKHARPNATCCSPS